MKKIAILGSRGIPNHYGGFEQFAMFFAVDLAKRGYDVSVYNSSLHPYQEKQYKGVNIVSIKDPEDKMGTAGQFIYDLGCILHSRKQNFDVIFQLGYTSSSIWSWLFPKKSKIFTNMDGIEWQRTKYSSKVQTFLKYAEKWAMNNSDLIIADSMEIKRYLEEKFKKEAHYVPYGAEVITQPTTNILTEFNVKAYQYSLVIARLEPENNIETILRAFKRKGSGKLLLIGNHETAYGDYLKTNYSGVADFLGAIHDQEKLDGLRYYCGLYFHGHSVGGTNPSLLEAMASHAFIVAHGNKYNRAVLGENALFFETDEEIVSILNQGETKATHPKAKAYILANLEKIATTYSFEKVHGDLIHFIENCTEYTR